MEDVVQKTLEELKNNQLLPEYERNAEYILPFLKEVAQMDATVTEKMAPMIGKQNMQEVEQALSATLGHELVDLIKKSIAIETYKMKVVEKPDGQFAVQISRYGIEFRSELMLKTRKEIEIATWLQSASLVIELLFFLLACLGIKVILSEVEMSAFVQEVERLVQEPTFPEALNTFVDAWNEAKAEGSIWEKAKAIYHFLKDTFAIGMYWKMFKLIYKLIFKDMSKEEKTKAIIQLVLMIVAASATKGLALIAKIALAVDFADYLAEKIANLVTFFDKKKRVETCSSKKMTAGNMYLILTKCLQNMIYFTNKEIFSGNDPLNFMEKKGCYDFV
jgi:uncharacterized membrane protein YhdT